MNVSICMSVLYSLNGTSQIPALRLKDLCRIGGRRIVRMRSGRSSQNNTFSKHKKKMQKLWEHVQDLHKINPNTYQQEGWEVAMTCYPKMKNYWHLIAIWRAKGSFFFFINWHLAYQPHSRAGLTLRSSPWKQTGFDVLSYF